MTAALKLPQRSDYTATSLKNPTLHYPKAILSTIRPLQAVYAGQSPRNEVVMHDEPTDESLMDFIRQECHDTGMDGYTVYQLTQNYWYMPQRVILPARTNPADLAALIDSTGRNPRWVFVPASQ